MSGLGSCGGEAGVKGGQSHLAPGCVGFPSVRGGWPAGAAFLSRACPVARALAFAKGLVETKQIDHATELGGVAWQE